MYEEATPFSIAWNFWNWKEAGFVATVVESNNHFSVALGRYATISEARLFAEQMWEAFENGYFIGRMRI